MTHTAKPAKRAGNVLLDAVLWVFAALGVFCAICFVAAMFFDVRPLLISTGSMEPTFEPNDVVFAQEIPAEEAEVGDITAIQTESMTIPVIHRIIETSIEGGPENGTVQIQMQGDANDRPDSTVYEPETVERYLFHVPGVAAVIDWMSSPMGFTLLAIPVPFLFFVVFWPWGQSSQPKKRGAAEAGGAEEKEAPTVLQRPIVGHGPAGAPRPVVSTSRSLPVFDRPAEKVSSR